ncbi:hypothetical protein V6N11_001314 [Hibiscus sabdariffa]|uniref:Uncharacterized protein n=1 Tax=Hibiscus sabdariffa TaxID=183260 RepID=A0ABR2RZV5_9ROSI
MGHTLLSFSIKDQGDLGASLSFSRKDRRDVASPFSISIVWGTFNRIGHALLSFNRKDQGDLSASLSLSRKDCRYLASPFSVSIVWGTLCYHSVEMTKLNLYRCPNRTSEKSFGRPPARATPAPTFQLFTLQRQVSTRQLLTAAPLIFRDVAGCRHVARPKLTDHDSLDSIGFGPI